VSSIAHDPLVAMFGIVGLAVLTAALLSGLTERTRLPSVLVFLLLGVALGPSGLGLVALGIEAPAMRVIATLGLVLVLFTDAVDVVFADLKRHARLAALILGPATLLAAALIAFAAWWLLDLGPAESAILGAALASTDPVLLRGLLRGRVMPDDARYALRIESGMNDAVLLPVVLLALGFAAPGGDAPSGADVGRALLAMFVQGIGGGVLVGLAGIGALHVIRARVGVRRDYESLYGLGVSLAAFAAAELAGGSGFLAAFAAGLTIAALDVELCECFFDYGQATAEMALLFTFVALGSSAIWRGFDVVSPAVLGFAAVALLVRTPLLLAVLAGTALDRRSRLLTAWFGPRGLSSLLLVMLAVFAGLPAGLRLFEVAALVVLLSVVVHGGSQMLFRLPDRGAGAGTIGAAATAAEPAPPVGASPLAAPDGERPLSPMVPTPDALWDTGDPERLTLEQLAELERRGAPRMLLDVRSAAAWEGSASQARGAVRAPAERAVEVVGAMNLPHDTWLVSYCT
jgi:NhaP-type Na+/H+ or K+/H+ antiporter